MRTTSLCLLALFAPVVALAQDSMDSHNLQFVPSDGDVHDPLTLRRSASGTAGAAFGGAIFEYANRPLTLTHSYGDGTTSRDIVVGGLGVLNLGGGYGLTDKLAIDAALPVYLASGGDLGGGPTLGDLRLAASYVLIDDGALSAGVVPHLDLPLGAGSRMLGRTGLGGGLLADVGWRAGAVSLGGQLGTQVNKKVSLLNVAATDSVLAGFSIGYAIDEAWGFHFESRNDLSLGGEAAQSEVLLTGRHRAVSGANLAAGVAMGVTASPGVPSFRLFVGGGFGTPMEQEEPEPVAPPVDPDPDGDGVVEGDACPDQAETANGYKDDDGCPDALATLKASATWNGKPVKVKVQSATAEGAALPSPLLPDTAVALSVDDACWTGSLALTLVEGENAAAVPLTRKESTVAWKVTNAKGASVDGAQLRWQNTSVASCSGEELVLSGGLGEQQVGIGQHTVRVEADGYTAKEVSFAAVEGESITQEVVLELAKVEVKQGKVAILEKVYFATSSADILAKSYATLDEVAKVLLANPQFERIEIAGHTDSQGNDANNLALSQARAESVRAYLINKGVEGGRLVAKGYGETKPLATNDTAAGRETNRRVEFNVTSK